MTCATISVRTAIGSICTPSDVSQCGQLYESVMREGAPGEVPLTSTMFTAVNRFLQCGQMLMGSSLMAGGGVETPSCHKGAPASAAPGGKEAA